MASLVPELAPAAGELHFVLCDFGKLGQAFIETDPARADRESVVEDIISGELARPVRVLALRPDGTWRDVSVEVAWAVTKAAAAVGDLLAGGTRDFVVDQIGHLSHPVLAW
jgi:hypothetical protein